MVVGGGCNSPDYYGLDRCCDLFGGGDGDYVWSAVRALRHVLFVSSYLLLFGNVALDHGFHAGGQINELASGAHTVLAVTQRDFVCVFYLNGYFNSADFRKRDLTVFVDDFRVEINDGMLIDNRYSAATDIEERNFRFGR